MKRLFEILVAALQRSLKVPGSPGPNRSVTDAAAETIGLVLDVSVPLPACQTDVEDLTERLRGHVMDLSRLLDRGRPGHSSDQLERAIVQAHALCRRQTPHDHVGSHVHLVLLAEMTDSLLASACSAQHGPADSVVRQAAFPHRDFTDQRSNREQSQQEPA